MTDILESLGNNEQLGKVLYELLGQIASSAATKIEERKCAHSSTEDETSPVCKSVPIPQCDDVGFVQNRPAFYDEKERSQTTNKNTVVDSTLGRPRYQWRDPEPGPRRSNLDPKQLYSVYVGHLPRDITKGELDDLFIDIGEVADSFVFPPSNGHTYTYGFVRFHTLEEAEDAVKQKNMKVIGNRQISVEFSSSTRRHMQNDPESEDSRPLLQREYTKVQRQSPSDKDEKQVVEKIKASFRRLNCNVSTVVNQNAEEVFENIKTILKMLINFPMSLAAPLAEMGKVESNDISTESGRRVSEMEQPGITFGKVTKQQETSQHSQTTSRLPSLAPDTVKNTVAARENYLPNGNMLSNADGTKLTTDVVAEPQATSPFCQTTSKLPSFPLTTKNTTSMKTSLGDNMFSKSGGPVNQNDVTKKQERIPLYQATSRLPSVRYNEYNAISGSSSGKDNLLGDASLREDNIFSGSSSGEDNLLAGLSSGEDNVLPCRSKPSGDRILDAIHLRSASSTDNEQHINTSCKLNPSFGEMRGNLFQPIPARGITSKFSDEVCLSANTNLQETTGFLECDSTSCGGRIYSMSNSLNQPSSSGGSSSYYPAAPSYLSTASLKKKKATDLDVPPWTATNFSYNTREPLGDMSDVPRFVSNTGDSSPKQFSFQGTEAVQGLLPSRNQALLTQDFLNSTGKNSEYCKKNVDLAEENEKLPSSTHNHVQMIDDAPNQCFIPLQNIEQEIKELTSTNRTLLEQPQPFNSQNCTRFDGMKEDKEPILSVGNAKSMMSVQQKGSSSELSVTSIPHSSPSTIWSDRGNQPKSLQASTGLYETGKSSSFVKMATQESFKTPEDITTSNRLLPTDNQSSSSQVNLLTSGESAKNIEFPVLNNGYQSGKAILKSPPKSTLVSDAAASTNLPVISETGLLDKEAAKGADLTPIVQKLFDNFRTCGDKKIAERLSGDDHDFGNGSGVRSSCGRRLAPSFSFSPQRKCLKGNDNTGTAFAQDRIRQTVQSTVGDSSANGSKKLRSEETANVMAEHGAIVRVSENENWKPAFCMSEFDFGFDSEIGSTSSAKKPAFETRSLLDSRCPGDDVETIQLKDQLNEHVRNLEKLQQTLDNYPQRRPGRSHCLFDHHPRGLELERQIHEAEILLEKKKEMRAARSNERDLAYEKELFHSVDDNPLLNQIAREMKKDSIRSEIVVTDHKCKILEMKIKLFQYEDSTQAYRTTELVYGK